MPKVFVECLYCGKKFEGYVYSQLDMSKLECPSCKESKQLKVKAQADESKDVFGYNNVTREDAYIKRNK